VIHAKAETIENLFKRACDTQVVDSHTHIQDDIDGFDSRIAGENLAGTQASFNRYPETVIKKSLEQKYLVRRLMTDPVHGLFYSWFAQIAEGKSGSIDKIIAALGGNSPECRKKAGRMLLDAIQDSRYSEYAEWLRIMFSFYLDGKDADPLDPQNFDALCSAMEVKRNDRSLASKILREHNILGYVTSIENRCGIPLNPKKMSVSGTDLSFSFHKESYNMFDANYLVWPGGATDFGLFLGGHKYEAEKYLLNLEDCLGVTVDSPEKLRSAVTDFLRKILWSPKSNPASRIRYTDIFHPIDFSLNESFDISAVTRAIRFQKAFLRDDSLRSVVSFVTRAMLEALEEIGREIKDSGEEYGSCLQIALGVTYFMDMSREIQSFTV
jgi:hypothetical protein